MLSGAYGVPLFVLTLFLMTLRSLRVRAEAAHAQKITWQMLRAGTGIPL